MYVFIKDLQKLGKRNLNSIKYKIDNGFVMGYNNKEK